MSKVLIGGNEERPMDLEEANTPRGFRVVEFFDQKGEECSLQKSSLAFLECIWFGLDKPHLVYENGGGEFKLPPNVLGFSRMHLTRENVRVLLPYLQRFAETGELYKKPTEES